MRRGDGLLAALSIFLLPLAAQGDAIEPPPDLCPEGTGPQTCHCGPRCGLRECPRTTTCWSGTTCEERSFCLEQLSCSRNGEDYERTAVTATCAGAGASCERGTCQQRRVCVPSSGSEVPPDSEVPSEVLRSTSNEARPDGAPRAPQPAPSCDCRATGRPSGGELLGVVAALIFWRRRS